MNTEILELYSDDELDTNPSWVKNEWINAGKKYIDVPEPVTQERERLLQIPAAYHSVLPANDLAVTQFLQLSLPKLCQKTSISLQLGFSDDEPDDLHNPETLYDITIPSADALLMDKHDGLSRRHPFWILKYFEHMQQTCMVFLDWVDAVKWLKKSSESSSEVKEEEDLKHTVLALLNEISWQGNTYDKQSDINNRQLANVLGDKLLGSWTVDAILAKLRLRLKKKGDTSIVIPTMEFASYVKNRVNTVKDSAQRYLNRCSTQLRDQKIQHLIFILYHPPFHWAACMVDFWEHKICYGNSLNWDPPESFMEHLNVWLDSEFPELTFSISNNLPCGIQKDSVSCAIAAVNCVAHSTLGNPLWTPAYRRLARMKTFVDLVKSEDQYAKQLDLISATSKMKRNLSLLSTDVDMEQPSMNPVKHRLPDSQDENSDKPQNKRTKTLPVHPLFHPLKPATISKRNLIRASDAKVAKHAAAAAATIPKETHKDTEKP
ncbi:hypothetical protein EDD85DRAFT_955927 [Armillaria nabsnona]|nr:hypothetical protein EDD85DRAFT_955927 [Armillaria nabsnona]